MIQKKSRFLLLIMVPWVVLPGFLGIVDAHASTANERETLRDISGMVVNSITFTSTPTSLERDLPLRELRAEVESEMREAGIPLIEQGSTASSGDVPHLQIQGAVSQITSNYYAYTIIIEVHQAASLWKKAGQPSLVVTWSEGALSTGDIQHFRDRLLFLTRLFIRDYQSVNGSSPQIWPLSWGRFSSAFIHPAPTPF